MGLSEGTNHLSKGLCVCVWKEENVIPAEYTVEEDLQLPAQSSEGLARGPSHTEPGARVVGEPSAELMPGDLPYRVLCLCKLNRSLPG